MNTDPTSLDRLHDLVLPAPTPWWPPAPGWLWLAGLMALVVLAMLLRGIIRRQRQRYRREALAKLARLQSLATAGELPAVLPALAELLKRTALTAYHREQVAALCGPAWFGFLDRNAGTDFSSGLGAAWESAIYRDDAAGWDEEQWQKLVSEIRHWIKRHADLPVLDPADTQPTSAGPGNPAIEGKAA